MPVSEIRFTSPNNFVPKPHNPGLEQAKQELKSEFKDKESKIGLALGCSVGLILTITFVAVVAITITAGALATIGVIGSPVFLAMCIGTLLLFVGTTFIAVPIISAIGLYKLEMLDDNYKKALEELPEKLEEKTL